MCRINAKDMDNALSNYDMLVHVSQVSDAIITYADTLTVRSAHIQSDTMQSLLLLQHSMTSKMSCCD